MVLVASDCSGHLPRWKLQKASEEAKRRNSNPDPKQWVGWGRRTVDDMFFAHANVVHLTQEDYDRIIEERKRKAVPTSSGEQ